MYHSIEPTTAAEIARRGEDAVTRLTSLITEAVKAGDDSGVSKLDAILKQIERIVALVR